jgi:hypothetical protein
MSNRNSNGKLLKRTTLSLDKETLRTLSRDTLEDVHGAKAQTAPTINLFGVCIDLPGDNILAARKKKVEAKDNNTFWRDIAKSLSISISLDTFKGDCHKFTQGTDLFCHN